MRVLVEVCVTGLSEALVAQECGADSVELCTWLACGGITPSSGTVDAVRSAVRIPVRVLVRPTPGGFTYTDPEVHALLTDAEILGGGAIPLVTGALMADGGPNMELMSAVASLAPESELTFHRAIDRSRSPMQVLDACLANGVDRILTSGSNSLAVEGIPVIRSLVERAGSELVIAAAGGLNADNVVRVIEQTGVTEVHFAAQRPKVVGVHGVSLSSTASDGDFEVEPDRAKIEAVMNALVKAGFR